MSLNLTLAAKQLVASVIGRSLQASVSASYLIFEVTAGQFFKTLQVEDAASWIDVVQRAFGKGLTEDAFIAEDTVFVVGKVLNEQTGVAESIAVSLGRGLSDDASLADDPAIAVGKALTDEFAVTESLARIVAFDRSFANAASVNDEERMHFEKNVPFGSYFSDYAVEGYFAAQYSGVPSELIGAAESISLGFGRPLSDAFGMTDVSVISFGLNLSDTVFATDDLDGQASALDDQEMQFFKSLTEAPGVTETLAYVANYQRAFSNASAMTDDDTLQVGKNISEPVDLTEIVEKSYGKAQSDNAIIVDLAAISLTRTFSDASSIDETCVKSVEKGLSNAASVGDSGSFIGQGYTTDLTYFAEDYVGFSGTFS